MWKEAHGIEAVPFLFDMFESLRSVQNSKSASALTCAKTTELAARHQLALRLDGKFDSFMQLKGKEQTYLILSSDIFRYALPKPDAKASNWQV